MAVGSVSRARRGSVVRRAGSLALLATACADPDARRVVAGRWVEVETDPEIEICGGQVELYDRFIESAPDVLGGTLPSDFSARLHAFTEDSRPETPAAGTSLGGLVSTSGTDAWVFFGLVDLHELGHTLAVQTIGRSLLVLNEGIAEGLSPNRRTTTVGFPLIPLDELLPQGRGELEQGGGFIEAGKFVRYVIDGYGAETFVELFDALVDKKDAAEIHATTEAVLGAPLPDVAADYATNGRCTFQVPFCGPYLPPQELPLALHGIVDCEASDTLGYVGPDPGRWLPYRAFAFAIDQPSALRFTVSGGTFHLRRCGDCTEQFRIGSVSAGPGETVDDGGSAFEFPAGRYFVLLEPADPEQTVEFEMDAP